MPIFNNSYDYSRFTKTTLYYLIDGPKPRFSIFSPTTQLLNAEKRIIEIVCYCLMPNHFHFLLQQKRATGITEFVSKLTNSYTKYFNIKNGRVGPLFQGEFKSVHIETNEQLLHLSRYIHLNPLVGYVTKYLESYKWSSYVEYTNPSISEICRKDIILSQFKSLNDYRQFVLDWEDYGKKIETIKHQLLDFEK